MGQSKKLPPYGYIFQQNLLSTGIPPYVYIFIGNNAWRLAGKWQPFAMVLPPWLSPNGFIWPVKGCKVAIFDTGYAEEDYVRELAGELYKGQAESVMALSPNYSITVFKKDTTNV